ncbi:hypothetical protein CDL15_Pgr005317 [Punica granatum]|nr:hypothetical protein CDL15_Pgr005317 [Punica granatum]PKI32346.1 hypothetical protein CRG98_047256 [Punica granatum]
MADGCGPVFSLNIGLQRLVVVSSPEATRESLSVNDRVLASRPNIAAGRYMGYDNAIFALAPYGAYWREIRKIAALELLSSHRLQRLLHVRVSEIASFMADLLSRSRHNNLVIPIDIQFEHLTFNINLRMIAGKKFADTEFGKTGSDAWRFRRAIESALYLSGTFVLSDAIPWLEPADIQGHVRAMKATAKEIDYVLDKWLKEHIERRKGEEEEADDFMEVLLKSLPESDDMFYGHERERVIKATVLILIMTGSESTALTMTWAVALLLNNPSTLIHAQEELDRVVGRDRWVQESDIESLKYLQAIVKETLRLYPPAPLTGLREAMEDCHIGGYRVPKGTRVLVNIWKLQRDPAIWSDPDGFRPERFLKEHKNVEVRGQSFEYIPFSSGRRSCPGATFGLQVVHLMLARMLQGFDMTIAGDGPIDMGEGQGIALPRASPLRVVLKPRLDLPLHG